MKKLICVPTFNEAENITKLLTAISDLKLGFDIAVIDDDSPDGTSAIVESLLDTYKNLHLITRVGKRSFASAYVEGFQYGLDNGYDYICEMDADFSHDPKALLGVNPIIESNDYDFIIGSRYVDGGMTKNWGLVRRLISRGGSFFSRSILNLPIRDLTGGFNFWSRSCLETIDINNIISDGYVFQIELKYKAYLKGMTFIEFPIIFEDRRVGQSKMGKGIVFEAMVKVIQLKGQVNAQEIRNHTGC